MTYLKENCDKILGKEFCEKLEECLKIRENRRKIYKDCFLLESSGQLLAIIEGKLKRFNYLYTTESLTDEQKSKIDDEIMDIINYGVFLLCVLDKEQKELN